MNTKNRQMVRNISEKQSTPRSDIEFMETSEKKIRVPDGI